MDKKKLLENVRRVIKETISEKKYPVAGENGYIRVSQLKKGDVLGGSGLEVVNITSGATTPSGKVAVSIAKDYLKDQNILFLNPETKDYIYIQGYEDYVKKIYDNTLFAKNASDKIPRIYY